MKIHCLGEVTATHCYPVIVNTEKFKFYFNTYLGFIDVESDRYIFFSWKEEGNSEDAFFLMQFCLVKVTHLVLLKGCSSTILK